MNFYEMMCLYKIMAVVFDAKPNTSLRQNEIDVAAELLKKLADDTPNWTHNDKENYKLLVDFVKENTKANLRGSE